MVKGFSFLLLTAAAAVSFACQTASAPSNTANRDVNAPANIAATNQPIPPEFSSKPVNINSANLPPGISDPKSANVNTTSNGPIAPGIDPKAAMKPNAKGTPPIPGIPSEAELKKQMANTKIDPNEVNRKVDPGNSKMMQTGKPKSNE